MTDRNFVAYAKEYDFCGKYIRKLLKSFKQI